MKCPMCDSECIQKKQITIDSAGIESYGGVRLYPAGQERLDRIEAVWQRYKHMDKVMCDTEILDVQHDITDLMLSDLWQAIRRDY